MVQCVVVCRSVLQCVEAPPFASLLLYVRSVAEWGSVLRCVAVWCKCYRELQCVAVC